MHAQKEFEPTTSCLLVLNSCSGMEYALASSRSWVGIPPEQACDFSRALRGHIVKCSLFCVGVGTILIACTAYTKLYFIHLLYSCADNLVYFDSVSAMGNFWLQRVKQISCFIGPLIFPTSTTISGLNNKILVCMSKTVMLSG